MNFSWTVRNRYVNLVDLIELGRRCGDAAETDIRIVRNIEELSAYCKSIGKIFRDNFDDSEEGNVVLRHLLRHIFRARRK
jgi:recombinational DNA repair protein RecT